jgi:hypothetical protein
VLKAKPLKVFRIGTRKIVVCKIDDNNPHEFIDQYFLFYDCCGELSGKIRIIGVSTVSNYASHIYDLCYSGDEIKSDKIGDSSVVSGFMRTLDFRLGLG